MEERSQQIEQNARDEDIRDGLRAAGFAVLRTPTTAEQLSYDLRPAFARWWPQRTLP